MAPVKKNRRSQKETNKRNQRSATKKRVMTTQTRKGGNQAQGRRKYIVTTKLFLGRVMNSADKFFVYALHRLRARYMKAWFSVVKARR